jgi:hypothetical protein
MGMSKMKAFLNVKETLEDVKASGELSGVVDDDNPSGPLGPENAPLGKNETKAGSDAGAAGEGSKSKGRRGFFKRFKSKSTSERGDKQADSNAE